MRGWRWWVTALLVVAASMTGRDALAATFVVDDASDQPDADPGDGGCATAAHLSCTLRAAIEEANAIGGEAHTIMLPTGGNGVWTPLPTVTQHLTIVGTGPYVSGIFGAHSSYPTTLLDVAPGVSLALHDLSLGYASGGAAPPYRRAEVTSRS